MGKKVTAAATADAGDAGESTQAVAVVGDRCRTRRRELGLSRLALAVKAGVDPSTVYRLERGVQAPGFERMAAIAKALDMTLAELVEGAA